MNNILTRKKQILLELQRKHTHLQKELDSYVRIIGKRCQSSHIIEEIPDSQNSMGCFESTSKYTMPETERISVETERLSVKTDRTHLIPKDGISPRDTSSSTDSSSLDSNSDENRDIYQSIEHLNECSPRKDAPSGLFSPWNSGECISSITYIEKSDSDSSLSECQFSHQLNQSRSAPLTPSSSPSPVSSSRFPSAQIPIICIDNELATTAVSKKSTENIRMFFEEIDISMNEEETTHSSILNTSSTTVKDDNPSALSENSYIEDSEDSYEHVYHFTHSKEFPWEKEDDIEFTNRSFSVPHPKTDLPEKIR
ncbi:hypothetical protein ADUPG1_009024, partial [Aduncisulcus paluster]